MLEAGVSDEQIGGKVDDPGVVESEGLESGDSVEELAEFRQVDPVARQRQSAEGPDVLSHKICCDLGKTETGHGA